MDKLDFWNQRAQLGMAAGTNDLIAKQLEINAILEYIKDNMTILDFGCGNGITMVNIAKKFDVKIIGIDFSSEMVAHARKLADKEGLSHRLDFFVGNENDLLKLNERFDLIYTERALINLDTWEKQKDTILNLCSLLKDTGKYVMCEASSDGLAEINFFRKQLSLKEIIPPWHNRYLVDMEINSLNSTGRIKLETVNYFSGTYYFISRIINAALAKDKGEEPAYDAPVNKLAFHLSSIGKCSQSRIWVWSKA